MFFLRRKRPYPNHLKYWIDAICINQEDKFEKSSQIPRMAEIYMNALCIHGELGPATKEEEAVVEDMKYLSGFMADEVKRVRSNRELRLPERYLKPYRPEVCENIGAFLGKSWWTRAWVMQEATALSTKDTYLFYGNASLRILEVMGTNIALHALEMLQPYGSQTGPTTRQYRIQRMSNIRSFREKDGRRPLLEILDQFRGLDATDKRDIVYAALNLSNDIDLNVFRPDYNKSIFEVYRDVAVYYLDHLPYPLDVLAYCGTRTQYP